VPSRPVPPASVCSRPFSHRILVLLLHLFTPPSPTSDPSSSQARIRLANNRIIKGQSQLVRVVGANPKTSNFDWLRMPLSNDPAAIAPADVYPLLWELERRLAAGNSIYLYSEVRPIYTLTRPLSSPYLDPYLIDLEGLYSEVRGWVCGGGVEVWWGAFPAPLVSCPAPAVAISPVHVHTPCPLGPRVRPPPTVPLLLNLPPLLLFFLTTQPKPAHHTTLHCRTFTRARRSSRAACWGASTPCPRTTRCTACRYVRALLLR
jgi:hypothetical protein